MGGAGEPVALARAVRVGKFESEKDCTGVEVGVATEVVKMGERLPEAKEVRPPPSVTISLNVTRVGGAEELVPLAKAVLAGKFEREKDRAGVEVEVATEVVKIGERLPEEKFVTVPAVAPARFGPSCAASALS